MRVFLAFYVVEVSSQHTSVIAGNASKRLRFVASQENNYYLSLALRVSLFENKISTLYQGFMKNLWPSTGIDSSRGCAAGTSVFAFMQRSVARRSSSMEAAVFNYSCRHTASICSCQAQMHKRCLLHLRICNVFSCGFKKLSVGAAWTVFMAKCCADHVKNFAFTSLMTSCMLSSVLQLLLVNRHWQHPLPMTL